MHGTHRALTDKKEQLSVTNMQGALDISAVEVMQDHNLKGQEFVESYFKRTGFWLKCQDAINNENFAELSSIRNATVSTILTKLKDEPKEVAEAGESYLIASLPITLEGYRLKITQEKANASDFGVGYNK
jgi:hypothetical protein